MYLEKLIINSNQGLVREVPFKEGLNLIVDETSGASTDSGNNIGKTTFLRIIDYCLGGSKDKIYTDPEFKRKNSKILDFLKKEDVTFELQFKSKKGITHKVIRPIEGKSFVDGEEMSSTTKFENKIKEIVFGFTDSRPTLGQLMNKFIRIESYQLENALFFLHDTADYSEYESLFMFLFGYRQTSILSDKRKIVNSLKKLKKQIDDSDFSVEDLEQQLHLIDKDILELEKQKSEFNFIESASDDLNSLKLLQSSISDTRQSLSKLNLKITLNNQTLDQLEKSKTNISTNALKALYDNAKLELGEVSRKFDEVVKFHNQMVNNKIIYIKKNVSKIGKNIEKLKNELNSNLDEESKILKTMSNKGALDEYDKLSIKLQNKCRDKGVKEGLIKSIQGLNSKLSVEISKLDEVNKKVSAFLSSYKENLKEFNVYFSSFSEKLYGEKYYLSTKKTNNKTTDNYLLDIGNLNENMGTGKKKAQISALDIAYLKYSEEKNLSVPYFVLHDQLETVFENQINTLFEMANSIKAQFIVAVLSDKLKKVEQDKVTESTILSLSQTDKLLKIN